MNEIEIKKFNELMKPECYQCYNLFRSISDPHKGYRCYTTPDYCPSKYIKSLQPEPDFAELERSIEVMKQMLKHYENLKNLGVN